MVRFAFSYREGRQDRGLHRGFAVGKHLQVVERVQDDRDIFGISGAGDVGAGPGAVDEIKQLRVCQFFGEMVLVLKELRGPGSVELPFLGHKGAHERRVRMGAEPPVKERGHERCCGRDRRDARSAPLEQDRA